MALLCEGAFCARAADCVFDRVGDSAGGGVLSVAAHSDGSVRAAAGWFVVSGDVVVAGRCSTRSARAGKFAGIAGCGSQPACYVPEPPGDALAVVSSGGDVAGVDDRVGVVARRIGALGIGGVALAFTQYIFIPARLLPLVIGLWLGQAWWAQRKRVREQWRGIVVMAVVSFVLTLPNIITFALSPEAFTARADNGSATTGGWIWLYATPEQGGVLGLLAAKMGVVLRAIGIAWDGPYTVMEQPMVGPLFYVGFLLAIGALVRWPRRIGYAWPALAIPVMLVTDLISGAVVEAHALHQIGVLPFVYILAGVGLAHGWQAMDGRIASTGGRRALAVGLLALATIPALWGTYRYLTEFIPAQYADPETGWRVEQIDVDISQRIIAEPERAYLVPYEEYTRSNVAWLTSEVFRERHSAIDAAGRLKIANPPDELTVVMPTDPFRIRHDGSQSQLDTRLWVLLVDGQALLLPPLTPEQEQDTLAFMESGEEEILRDRSGTEIASFFSATTPVGLFDERQVIDYKLDAVFNDEIKLVGYALRDRDLTPGKVVFVTLFWQAQDERPAKDYEIFLQFWNDDSESLAGAHELPYSGMYHTRLWRPDEVTATHHWVRVPSNLERGRYTLVAGLFEILKNENVAATGSSVDEPLKVVRAPDLRYPIEQSLEVERPFGEQLSFGDVLDVAQMDIRLDASELSFGKAWSAEVGQTLAVDVIWEVAGRPAVDYSVFLHLSADDDSEPLAQLDVLLGGSYPSGAWRKGELQGEQLRLQLPLDLPSGEYVVWLGMYYWQSGERLAVTLNDALQAEGRVRIGSIAIP